MRVAEHIGPSARHDTQGNATGADFRRHLAGKIHKEPLDITRTMAESQRGAEFQDEKFRLREILCALLASAPFFLKRRSQIIDSTIGRVREFVV